MADQINQINEMNSLLGKGNEIDPNDILKQVLTEYPGLAKVHSLKNTQALFAPIERMKGAQGQLEYWPADEPGTTDFPHPNLGKNILEIYSSELKSDPIKLKNAIYGDLMHGMVNDPTWSSYRDEFGKNYTPEETKRMTSRQSWWEDANGIESSPNAATDAYIRGWLNENDIAQQGQTKYKNTMYSPVQIDILDKMKKYLKTGK